MDKFQPAQMGILIDDLNINGEIFENIHLMVLMKYMKNSRSRYCCGRNSISRKKIEKLYLVPNSTYLYDAS